MQSRRPTAQALPLARAKPTAAAALLVAAVLSMPFAALALLQAVF